MKPIAPAGCWNVSTRGKPWQWQGWWCGSDPGGLGRRLDRPGHSLTVLAGRGFQVAARLRSRHLWSQPGWISASLATPSPRQGGVQLRPASLPLAAF